jgi:hypothetical protein
MVENYTDNEELANITVAAILSFILRFGQDPTIG